MKRPPSSRLARSGLLGRWQKAGTSPFEPLSVPISSMICPGCMPAMALESFRIGKGQARPVQSRVTSAVSCVIGLPRPPERVNRPLNSIEETFLSTLTRRQWSGRINFVCRVTYDPPPADPRAACRGRVLCRASPEEWHYGALHFRRHSQPERRGDDRQVPRRHLLLEL